MIRIKRGLDLPIAGAPAQSIDRGPRIGQVALLGDDYVGLKPALAVREGDSVRRGQTLFTDRRNPRICFASPASGTVAAIHRGEKRRFQSLVVQVQGNDEQRFASYDDVDLRRLDRETVCEQLLASGLWTGLRSRPYSRIPDPATTPQALFVTAIDSNPLAARPEVVLAESRNEFIWGLQVIRHLTPGKLFLCQAAGSDIPGGDLDFVSVERFSGPHPAGLPGTHIHFLCPVGLKRTVWHVGYQDVVAIGRLFVSGRPAVERVISLGGPPVQRPRLLRTILGARVSDLVAGELADGPLRVISGPVVSGRTAAGPFDFLGRYHLQVSVLADGAPREFLGWQSPGFDKFSVTRVFASAFLGRRRRYAFTTSMQGSRRAMVPIGTYERVMPLDIVPTYLLRALITGDVEQAQLLGCLELDEEDLGLCDFVCPGKYEYGPLLRRVLAQIEKEG